jgi:hypothetical protein
MAFPTRNPADESGGVLIRDRFAGQITDSIADRLYRFKTLAAALTRVDAAAWAAALIIASEWGWR